MIRPFAIGLLLASAACHRSGVADVTLDADAAQRNATSAKMLADLAAADAASRGPAPEVHDRAPTEQPPAAPSVANSSEADLPAEPLDAPAPDEDGNVTTDD